MLFNVRTLRELKGYLGQEIGVSPWMEMTQARINDFAEVSEDRQWIHVDPDRAARGPLGGTVAHGFLLLSLLPHLLSGSPLFQMKKRMVVNYGLDRVRFVHPVKPGEKFRARGVLAEIRRKGLNRLLLKIEATVEIVGRDKPALVAEMLVMFFL